MKLLILHFFYIYTTLGQNVHLRSCFISFCMAESPTVQNVCCHHMISELEYSEQQTDVILSGLLMVSVPMKSL
jgi:hypothetical protein